MQSANSVCTLELEGLDSARAFSLPNGDRSNLAVLQGNGLACVILDVQTIGHIGHGHILQSCVGTVDPVETIIATLNGNVLHHNSASGLIGV